MLHLSESFRIRSGRTLCRDSMPCPLREQSVAPPRGEFARDGGQWLERRPCRHDFGGLVSLCHGSPVQRDAGRRRTLRCGTMKHDGRSIADRREGLPCSNPPALLQPAMRKEEPASSGPQIGRRLLSMVRQGKCLRRPASRWTGSGGAPVVQGRSSLPRTASTNGRMPLLAVLKSSFSSLPVSGQRLRGELISSDRRRPSLGPLVSR